MTDREIFRKNLNYYLEQSGKKQKELAEAIGAKYTTVSGWTRGISYPRADAMEKIADFFGIPTSRLVGDRNEIIDDNEKRVIVIPDSEKFVKIVSAMSVEDYKTVMRIYDETYKRMKERGEID